MRCFGTGAKIATMATRIRPTLAPAIACLLAAATGFDVAI